MENQHTDQSETSAGQAKKGNSVKRLPMAGIVLGIIATAFVIIWLTNFAAASSSRLSTPSEIAVQKEFQDKWDTAQKEAEQKWDAILVDASSSRLSGTSEITAQEEFQQKVDALTQDAEQKSDSNGK